MASLPTGSDKLLEISTSEVTVVIKTKKKSSTLLANTEGRVSSLVVCGCHIHHIEVKSQGINEKYDIEGITSHCLNVHPLFFEQTDYELVIESNAGTKVGFWNENYLLREKVSPVSDHNPSLITGIINFDNRVGYSEFEISVDGHKALTMRIEVYPSKISYKEDYHLMMADISEYAYNAAIDFMQKTYREFSVGDQQNSVPAIFFQIVTAVFEKYMSAVGRILQAPNHKLITTHTAVPEYKAKRTDRKSERWLFHHQEYVEETYDGFNVNRILSVKKQITYNTVENRFVKYILKDTVRKLCDFKKRFIAERGNKEKEVIVRCEKMEKEIRRALSAVFFSEVSDYTAAQSMSLVFGMAPGYRELYKYYLLLHRGLSVNGDVFRISVKDTAQLYEYWCFIKLFALLKKEYKLVSPDIIRVDSAGITITLVKGRRSEILFINPRTLEQIKLVYNPGETQTQTVNQRPDNVLELEKKGSVITYKYIFDAKYRIESNPSDPYYPDNNPGPKVDDINTMHRYRDSIVYENKASKFTFSKTMFGAYILFPYANEELYSQHHFYKSIDTVNIGGLPFLPGATELVKKLLDELIADSRESAFERTTLPAGIEEKLTKVDWNRKDVLIGTFRDKKQFDVCFQNRFYYIPKRMIPDSALPIHWVALYQTKEIFGLSAGIRYYGELISFETVKRSEISEVLAKHGHEDELYYRMNVADWKELQKPILPKEQGFSNAFTNMFLLVHSEFCPELRLESEDEYRFYAELKRLTNSAEINESGTNIGFVYGDTSFAFAGGKIIAMKCDRILSEQTIESFSKRPAETFRRLRDIVGTKG